jgi:glyoxylase-like metal-dependent hydrolase (beta-lactamase superfamily II)
MRNWTLKEAEPTRRWKVGSVTVTKVSEGVLESGLDAPSPEEGFLGQASCEALLAIEWLRPDFVTEQGDVRLAFHALVIETSTRRIVVDTCVGNDKGRPQQPFWDHLGLPFLQNFAAAGFAREAIDTVVCTHLHVDHVGWNTMKVDGRWVPTFPNARYLIGRTEYEHCYGLGRDGRDGDSLHPAVFMEDSIQPVFDAGLVDLVDANERICDEVCLVPTHGHTVGHVSVLIESAGQRAIITGDTIHHPCQLTHPDWAVRADSDKAAAVATRARLLDGNAGTQTLFIGTHWAGRSSGRVERAGETYRLI